MSINEPDTYQENRARLSVIAMENSARNSPAVGHETPIEVDSLSGVGSGENENDSSYSLEASVYSFQKENGRTYHSYRAGAYIYPNDPTEMDRLDFQFEIFKYAFNDRNYFAPLSTLGPNLKILDIGTGTGQWAIEMGDEFPNAHIQATDLSPIQPSSVPENVHFFIDDASEEDWAVPPAHFHYIHSRMMLGSFPDFRDIIRKSKQYLQPGGWIECQELMTTPYCDDGTMPPDFPFLEWSNIQDKAAMEADRPLRIANRLKRWMQEAGFVDVQEKVFKLPLNGWAKDKDLKMIGRMQEENWLTGLSAFTMAPFYRALNWSKAEIEVYLVDVRKSISDRRIHAYHRFYVVWGRKPLEGEVVPPPPTSIPQPAPPTPATSAAGPST